MTDVSSPQSENSLATKSVTRRAIGKAVWVAPVIVAASQAPALAASGPAALDFDASLAARSQLLDLQLLNLLDLELGVNSKLNINSGLDNLNNQATVGLQVSVTVTTSVGDLDNARAFNTIGWVLVDEFGTGNGITKTWTYVAGGQIPGNGHKEFNPSIFLGSTLHVRIFEEGDVSGTVSLVATATGATPDATEIAFH